MSISSSDITRIVLRLDADIGKLTYLLLYGEMGSYLGSVARNHVYPQSLNPSNLNVQSAWTAYRRVSNPVELVYEVSRGNEYAETEAAYENRPDGSALLKPEPWMIEQNYFYQRVLREQEESGGASDGAANPATRTFTRRLYSEAFSTDALQTAALNAAAYEQAGWNLASLGTALKVTRDEITGFTVRRHSVEITEKISSQGVRTYTKGTWTSENIAGREFQYSATLGGAITTTQQSDSVYFRERNSLSGAWEPWERIYPDSNEMDWFAILTDRSYISQISSVLVGGGPTLSNYKWFEVYARRRRGTADNSGSRGEGSIVIPVDRLHMVEMPAGGIPSNPTFNSLTDYTLLLTQWNVMCFGRTDVGFSGSNEVAAKVRLYHVRGDPSRIAGAQIFNVDADGVTSTPGEVEMRLRA